MLPGKANNAEPRDWSMADLVSAAILIAGVTVLAGVYFESLREGRVELGAVERPSSHP